MNPKLSNLTPDLSTLTLGEQFAMCKERIYFYASMPCPLKTPFGQFIKPYIHSWNSNQNNIPIYCPLDTDCSSDDLKERLLNATSDYELPDIFTTTAYDVIFSEVFRKKFIETGIYGAFPTELYKDEYPDNIKKASEKFRTGFLGFSSWGMVQDLSFKKSYPVPQGWKEIINPEFKGLFSIHGCHGHAGSLSMLLSLVRTEGESVIGKLAENMHKVWHFSRLIKEINTKSEDKTPFYILPYVAITNIPSVKNIEVLPLHDSIITPMLCVVKQSKMEQCMELLKFLTNSQCKQMLSKGAYFQPFEINGIEKHKFEDLEELTNNYYEKAAIHTNTFIELLGDKMS